MGDKRGQNNTGRQNDAKKWVIKCVDLLLNGKPKLKNDGFSPSFPCEANGLERFRESAILSLRRDSESPSLPIPPGGLTGADFLSWGIPMSIFGFELLGAQVAEYLISEWSWRKDGCDGDMAGDTPIEKLLCAALEIQCQMDRLVFLVNRSEEKLDFCKTSHTFGYSPRLIVQPQKVIESRRVDFLVHSEYETGWRKLIVECDGHDFHERTKEQAARDRSKDREATLAGVETFRFTGSEIWRDPLGCASQITEWAMGGWGQ